MFDETYYVWSRTNEKYHTHIKAYYPNNEDLEAYLQQNGHESSPSISQIIPGDRGKIGPGWLARSL
jgi:hypothetical protein